MPKDTSIKRILVIGSGPIVIGQGCEFDYSGVQACKALREEGYEVVLINSNPATIMTDPEFAFRTYIEPITPEMVEKIIIKEKPDVLLPTLGGQTALNTAMSLHRAGTLEKHGVRMIGAKPEAIEKGEDRLLFKNAMLKIGLDLPQSGVAHTMEEAREIAAQIGTLPLIIRPAYTLGGTGGGIAYNKRGIRGTITAKRGLDLSPVSEILVEESLLGWKEYRNGSHARQARTTASSSAPSKTSTPWASTPAIQHHGRSHPDPHRSSEYQLMRDFASFAVHPRRSASKPVDPTSSSPCIPTRVA